MSAEAIVVREYRHEADQAFVYSTWLRNYKYSSYFAKRIKPAIFFAGQHKVIDHLLAKPSTKVVVACDRNDADTIMGYLAFEPGVVHFVFVKDAYRKLGVATALFASQRIDVNQAKFTHWCFPVDELIRKFPDMTYDPYCL